MNIKPCMHVALTTGRNQSLQMLSALYCLPCSIICYSLTLILLVSSSTRCQLCFVHHTLSFNVRLVQSYWTEWGEWGPCSTTVCDDVGIQVRQRKCVNSQPMPLLLVPACQGHHSERRECSTPPCTGENCHSTCAIVMR